IADTADKRLDSAVGMRGKERDLRDADDWADYAGRLFNGHRYNKAIEASDRALMLDSSHMLAARHGIHARLHACDWRRRVDDRRRIAAGLSAGQNIIGSVFHRAISDSESESRMLALLRA